MYSANTLPSFKGNYSPTIVEVNSGRYIITGSQWIKVDHTVTIELARKKWSPKYPRYQTASWKVNSSNTNEVYTVSLINRTQFTCTCVGYKFHKNCKHIKMIKEKYDL